MDVLYGLALGFSNKEIAILLGITEQTVRNHLSHVYDKVLPKRKGGERGKKYRILAAVKAQEILM